MVPALRSERIVCVSTQRSGEGLMVLQICREVDSSRIDIMGAERCASFSESGRV